MLEKAVFSNLTLWFVDVDLDAPNDAVLSPNLVRGLYKILYNQQTSPNTPVSLEKALFGHLTLWFVYVDALNDAVSGPNLACGFYMILYHQQTSPNALVLVETNSVW